MMMGTVAIIRVYAQLDKKKLGRNERIHFCRERKREKEGNDLFLFFYKEKRGMMIRNRERGGRRCHSCVKRWVKGRT